VRTHILDASALYRYLTNGDGAQIVADVLKQVAAAGSTALMSVVNWGEVYYTLVKHIGLSKTDKLMAELVNKVPIRLAGVEAEDAMRAVRLKAQHNLPCADAFAAALTGS
jgi:PIN domain nuclease of toxin-antitoxin system